MPKPFDTSEILFWIEQADRWLTDYQSASGREVEVLQMALTSLSRLQRSAEELRQQIRERLGAK